MMIRNVCLIIFGSLCSHLSVNGQSTIGPAIETTPLLDVDSYLSYTGSSPLYSPYETDNQEKKVKITLPQAADLGITEPFTYDRFVLKRWTMMGFQNSTEHELVLELKLTNPNSNFSQQQYEARLPFTIPGSGLLLEEAHLFITYKNNQSRYVGNLSSTDIIWTMPLNPTLKIDAGRNVISIETVDCLWYHLNISCTFSPALEPTEAANNLCHSIFDCSNASGTKQNEIQNCSVTPYYGRYIFLHMNIYSGNDKASGSNTLTIANYNTPLKPNLTVDFTHIDDEGWQFFTASVIFSPRSHHQLVNATCELIEAYRSLSLYNASCHLLRKNNDSSRIEYRLPGGVKFEVSVILSSYFSKSDIITVLLNTTDNILPPSNITVQSGPLGIGYSLFLSWQTLVGQRWNLTAVACNATEGANDRVYVRSNETSAKLHHLKGGVEHTCEVWFISLVDSVMSKKSTEQTALTYPLLEISFNVSYYYPGFNISAGNFYFDLLMPPIEESVFKSILIVIETYKESQADFIPVLNQTYTASELGGSPYSVRNKSLHLLSHDRHFDQYKAKLYINGEGGLVTPGAHQNRIYKMDLVAPVFNVTLTDHGTRVRYDSEIIPNNNGNFSTEIECVADPLSKDNNGECNITKATGNTASTFFSMTPGVRYVITAMSVKDGRRSKPRNLHFILPPKSPIVSVQPHQYHNGFQMYNLTAMMNLSSGRIDNVTFRCRVDPTITAVIKDDPGCLINVTNWRSVTLKLHAGLVYQISVTASSFGVKSETARIHDIVVDPSSPSYIEVTSRAAPEQGTVVFNLHKGRNLYINTTVITYLLCNKSQITVNSNETEYVLNELRGGTRYTFQIWSTSLIYHRNSSKIFKNVTTYPSQELYFHVSHEYQNKNTASGDVYFSFSYPPLEKSAFEEIRISVKEYYAANVEYINGTSVTFKARSLSHELTNKTMVLPPQHRHPGKKYRYNLIIIGLDGLSTPANETNTELVIAPLPPTNFSISKDKRHPVLNLKWALSDKSWQDQLNIKIGTQHHTLNPHIILRNVTRFSPTEYALSTLTLPKAVDLTIKMSASSFGVEGPDSISVIIKLKKSCYYPINMIGDLLDNSYKRTRNFEGGRKFLLKCPKNYGPVDGGKIWRCNAEGQWESGEDCVDDTNWLIIFGAGSGGFLLLILNTVMIIYLIKNRRRKKVSYAPPPIKQEPANDNKDNEKSFTAAAELNTVTAVQ